MEPGRLEVGAVLGLCGKPGRRNSNVCCLTALGVRRKVVVGAFPSSATSPGTSSNAIDKREPTPDGVCGRALDGIVEVGRDCLGGGRETESLRWPRRSEALR